MAVQVVLLRGVNLGPSRRIAMPALREALSAAGFEDARTYVQSGNLVLSSAMAEGALAAAVSGLIAARFGLDVDVVVRTREELAEVVASNPIPEGAQDPKRYVVSFCSSAPDPGRFEPLLALADPVERVVVAGREIYAYHPAGLARSKLWAALSGPKLGVLTTARNWTTVTTLLKMASE